MTLETPYEDIEIIEQPFPLPVVGDVLFLTDDLYITLFADYQVIEQPSSGDGGGEECPDDRPSSGMLYPRG